jgi:hypothetical protein
MKLKLPDVKLENLLKMINKKVVEFAKLFNQMPNAPFLYGHVLKKILLMLKDLGLSPVSSRRDLYNGNYSIDEYCLFVKFRRGNPRYSLIIDTHIDHPGFVIGNDGIGVAFGSVGFHRLEKLLEASPPEIDIFSNQGELVSTKKITRFHYANKPYIYLEDNLGIPNNSHGIWHLPEFSEDESHLYMKNADNMIATAVAFAIIDDIVNSPKVFRDIDVTFIFTFLEEVFEISANHVAIKKNTPFGKIDPETNILVLESMQSVPLHADDIILQNRLDSESLKNLRLNDDNTFYSPELREEIFSQGMVNRIYSDVGLALPNYDDGLQIKINDTDCVYGTFFPDQDNRAENLLLQVVEAERIKVQHTVSGGACNGTAYSLFPTTSNIVTLNIPNPRKHNIGENGEIVLEKIKKQNVQGMYEALVAAINFQEAAIPNRGISKMLKSSNLAYDSAVLRKLQIERSNVTWGARWRLALGKYFPDHLAEELLFKTRGLAARVREKLNII